MLPTVFLTAVHVLILIACVAHILLRRHRQPESRVAWIVVVLSVPYLGALAYLILGQTNIGRKRTVRLSAALETLPAPDRGEAEPNLPADVAPLFHVGVSISNYPAVGGNSAQLMADSDATIDAIVADIDAANDHVHLLFYIWLADTNGSKIAQALIRAAKRGVDCRAMVDDLGSRDLLRNSLWREMEAAGVQTRRALRVGNPILRSLTGRVDLRNHRKIVVIDNAITYCGSQNCADPAFLPKAKFGPWVDAVMRFEGPVVRQNQHLFASDWMGNGGDDISTLVEAPLAPARSGFVAQVLATGPTFRNSAMPEIFQSLIYAARKQLFVTTPYYVPNSALHAALCACANRGVETTLILPARNDDFAVGAASRSYYEDLLTAGVRIHEYLPGLLHTKSLTMDGRVTLIGSANMDRRSFDLNYENNILFCDAPMTRKMLARQESYLADSRVVTLDAVRRWSAGRQLMHNVLAIVGPVL